MGLSTIDNCISNVLFRAKKGTVSQERAKKIRSPFQLSGMSRRQAMEVFQGIRRPVGKGILFQVAPDIFHGIEFGSIGRKERTLQTLGRADVALNDFGPMGGQIVPYHHDRFGQLGLELVEEIPGGHRIDIGIRVQLEGQEHVVGARRPTEGGDDRDFSMGAGPLKKKRCVTPGAPRPADQGGHQEPGFVDEGNPGSRPFGFFLSAGQTVLTHPSIRSSFRSRARRSGFWGLHPNACRSLPT